ncbi:MAG: MFS transporter, partial [Rhodospirillales bacterium]|nr:MFS transporter [Rhodospirillales bacterium]
AIPSAIMIVALWFTLEKDKLRLGLLKEGDWAGIVTMAVGLSELQTLLEEGNKDDWYGSPFIVKLAVIAVVFLTAFVWIELKVQKPLVDLRLLKNRNFGIGTVANMLVGFALFGTVYVLPQYLGQVQGYNAEQIGNVLAWTGLPQLLIIPFVPLLMKHFDVRYIGVAGIALFALSCFMNVNMSLDYSGDQFFLPNIVRAVGQALILTPLTAIATSGIAPKDAANASGLFNMLRNLAGAVGTAALETIITKREQFHSNVIGQSVTVYRDEVRQRIDEMTSYFMAHGISDAAAARHQAIIALGKTVKRQALVMGFSDTFAVIAVMLAIAAVALLFAQKAPRSSGASAAHRSADTCAWKPGDQASFVGKG